MLAIARICQRQLAQSLFSIQENTRILDCHKLCVWLIKGSKQMIYNTLKQNIGLPTVWTTPQYKHWGLGEAGYEGLELNLYYSFHRSINMLVSNCLHKLLTLAQRTRFVHEQAWIAPWMSTSIDKPSFLSVVISFSAVRASDKFRWRPLIVHCWRHWSNKNAGLSSVYWNTSKHREQTTPKFNGAPQVDSNRREKILNRISYLSCNYSWSLDCLSLVIN